MSQIGDISFFDQLASDADTSTIDTNEAEEQGAGAEANIEQPEDKSTTPSDPSTGTDAPEEAESVYRSRTEELVASLLQNMSINQGGFYDRRSWLLENKKMVQTAESISEKFGIVVRCLLQVKNRRLLPYINRYLKTLVPHTIQPGMFLTREHLTQPFFHYFRDSCYLGAFSQGVKSIGNTDNQRSARHLDSLGQDIYF